jgi:hypothetical protein
VANLHYDFFASAAAHNAIAIEGAHTPHRSILITEWILQSVGQLLITTMLNTMQNNNENT